MQLNYHTICYGNRIKYNVRIQYGIKEYIFRHTIQLSDMSLESINANKDSDMKSLNNMEKFLPCAIYIGQHLFTLYKKNTLGITGPKKSCIIPVTDDEIKYIATKLRSLITHIYQYCYKYNMIQEIPNKK